MELGGIFSLPQSDGYTESERFLARLCRRSFLRLWSLPNTYRAPNKELIDVLLVFGSDVILFSDKNIALPTQSDLDVTWPRWGRRAIDDSARQLGRAKNWLTRSPAMVFLDRKASHPIPVELPRPADARYHLIATARGASAACAEVFGTPYGSLVVNSAFPDGWNSAMPFHIGPVKHKAGFIHVFDELSIELVLSELDTVVDFIEYLKAREAFLGDGRIVTATGEEQLLAAYFFNKDKSQTKFLPQNSDRDTTVLINFDDTHAEAYFNGAPYRAKQKANVESYGWDRLIETFIEIGNPAYLGETIAREDVELALRTMATESRFSRRMLVQSLRDFFSLAAKSDPEHQRFRTVMSRQAEGKAYVFFVLPKDRDWDYQQYREERKVRLTVYCTCLLAKHPTLTAAIGLGFDHPLKTYEGRSEDLIVIPQAEISELQRAELLESASDLGILGDALSTTGVSFAEYPDLENPTSPGGEWHHEAKKLGAKEKQKRKQAKRSRRKNRRR